MSSPVVQGWTIVTQLRKELSPDHMQGVFLATTGPRWIIGRQYDGPSGSSGFIDEEWWHGRYFTMGSPTENMMAALDAYPEAAMKAGVGDRMTAQDATQSLARFLAGPERPGRAHVSAGWQESDSGHRNPGGASTELLPLHEAKAELFWFLLWSTRLNAMERLTKGVTIDRQEAHSLVRGATGPIRFDFGYNTYWLAEATA
ncbi:hypothetical protein AB0M10_15195 [Streptomyces sp. NPDC051840]|uniref:hypothetical protein n=1 Tax=Streptomyces sp. NPDC051840 TaxID=3154752 RepID=UPI003420E41A